MNDGRPGSKCPKNGRLGRRQEATRDPVVAPERPESGRTGAGRRWAPSKPERRIVRPGKEEGRPTAGPPTRNPQPKLPQSTLMRQREPGFIQIYLTLFCSRRRPPIEPLPSHGLKLT